jgi:4-amino-4-deoxy-L-arabinose transferase-like glycosyltransferase
MVPPERAGRDSAFTVSIDHVDAGRGIGAADRALTIRRAVEPEADHAPCAPAGRTYQPSTVRGQMIRPAQGPGVGALAPDPRPAPTRDKQARQVPIGMLVLVGLAVAVGFVIAIRNRRLVLYDDAAITLRYAARIAAGDGFTYNTGDHTLGASAPLYTLVLAGAHWVGLNLEFAARAIAVVAYAATFGLAAFIGQRIGGWFTGIVAVLFLAVMFDYQTQAFSGMESALAAALGLAAIALLIESHDSWAGVLLGLALWNKLDAGLLVLAVIVAYLVIVRRPPWRLLLASALVVLPWLVFAQLYFGSPIPYSATQKLSILHTSALNHAWILDLFRTSHLVPVAVLAVLAAVAVPFLARDHPRPAAGLLVCVLWPLLHAVTFSFVNLGSPYPWYTTVLYPPVAIAAACTLGLAARALTQRGLVPAVAAVCAAAIGVAAVLYVERSDVRSVARAVRHGHQLDSYENFEAVRKQAGIDVSRLARPGEVIETCYGWVAYENERSPIKESTARTKCPLSTRKPVAPPSWLVTGSYPGIEQPPVPGRATLVKELVSTANPGGAMFIYRLRPSTATRAR